MATTHEIKKFIESFNGGTRPNRFKVECDWNGTRLFETHCSTATLPDATIGQIQIPFRGRMYNLPGDREYKNLTVQIIDDLGDRNAWEKLHEWHNTINQHKNNVTDTGSRDHFNNYAGYLRLTMLDHNSSTDKPIKIFKFLHAYPVVVGGINLDQNTANQIAQFQVTFSYTHYYVEGELGTQYK